MQTIGNTEAVGMVDLVGKYTKIDVEDYTCKQKLGR